MFVLCFVCGFGAHVCFLMGDMWLNDVFENLKNSSTLEQMHTHKYIIYIGFVFLPITYPMPFD